MGIEHFIDRMENATELHRGISARALKNLYHRQKEPPQSLKTALWRFDFMNWKLNALISEIE